MLSPNDCLEENILVRNKADFRILCFWEGIPLFVRIMMPVSKIFLSPSMYIFRYLITLLVSNHIVSIMCTKGRFIIPLLSLTMTIIYNDKVVKQQ